MATRAILLMTGERQVGKTTLCLRLIEGLQAVSVKVTGLVTRRTGPHDLEVKDLVEGAVYPLTLPFASEGGVRLPNFIMDPAALEKGAASLRRSFPTQVFVLDEIGPLELKRRQGWAQALTWLQTADFQVAVVVVRPELLYDLLAHLGAPLYTVVPVSRANRETLPALLHSVIIATLRGNDGGMVHNRT